MTANDDAYWPEFEPLLAGTVALMTCFPDQSKTSVARRIANNLLVLARHPSCGNERLRYVLLRAREHWADRARNDDDAAADAAAHAPADAAAHAPADAAAHAPADAAADAQRIRAPVARLLRARRSAARGGCRD